MRLEADWITLLYHRRGGAEHHSRADLVSKRTRTNSGNRPLSAITDAPLDPMDVAASGDRDDQVREEQS